MKELQCEQCGKKISLESEQGGYRVSGKALCWTCGANELRMDKVIFTQVTSSEYEITTNVTRYGKKEKSNV